MHFWDPARWDKVCFECQRIKSQWKKNQNFHICLRSGLRGLTPPPLTISLTVKRPSLFYDSLSQLPIDSIGPKLSFFQAKAYSKSLRDFFRNGARTSLYPGPCIHHDSHTSNRHWCGTFYIWPWRRDKRLCNFDGRQPWWPSFGLHHMFLHRYKGFQWTTQPFPVVTQQWSALDNC